MRIVTRDELCKCPNGTVFAEYTPNTFIGDLHVMTGSNEIDNWNGAISIMPFCVRNKNDKDDIYTSWMSSDDCTADYYKSQLFAVFNKREIKQMIDLLIFALSDCADGSFDEDVWIDDYGATYSDNEIYSICDI